MTHKWHWRSRSHRPVYYSIWDLTKVNLMTKFVDYLPSSGLDINTCPNVRDRYKCWKSMGGQVEMMLYLSDRTGKFYCFRIDKYTEGQSGYGRRTGGITCPPVRQDRYPTKVNAEAWRSIYTILNKVLEDPKIHIWCKFGDHSSITRRVIMRTSPFWGWFWPQMTLKVKVNQHHFQ